MPDDGKVKNLWCVILIATKPINDILAHEASLSEKNVLKFGASGNKK